MSQKATSVYIHIPFCDSLCPYCDFAKVLKRTGFEQPYMEALLKDIDALEDHAYKTIYIGGGTPSCLDFSSLERLFEHLSKKMADGCELTFEANPESLDEKKIELLASSGVNRVSMGVQSSSRRYLDYLGRHHDMAQIEQKVALLRKSGIDNINLDLMYGFASESLLDVSRDIQAILSLNPNHISTYSLMIEPHTEFRSRGEKERDEDFLARAYDLIRGSLDKAGYHRYEVSNFAKPGYESKHNLVYWRDERYIGLGAGASGYEGDIRYRNTASVPAYIAGKRHIEEEKVSKESDRTYFLLTHLRLEEGFDLEEFASRFEEDLRLSKKEELDALSRQGKILIEGTILKVHPDSLYVLDSILLKLI